MFLERTARPSRCSPVPSHDPGQERFACLYSLHYTPFRRMKDPPVQMTLTYFDVTSARSRNISRTQMMCHGGAIPSTTRESHHVRCEVTDVLAKKATQAMNTNRQCSPLSCAAIPHKCVTYKPRRAKYHHLQLPVLTHDGYKHRGGALGNQAHV